MSAPRDRPPAVSPAVAPVADIAPGALQPRRRFDDADLDALTESIRSRGVVQPILVRPDPDGPARFRIVAGERRWRAAKRAGLREVPVVVRRLDDREALEIALVENLQRENLGPIEEAEGYRRLIDEFGGTQAALARAVGRSRAHIANTMRLLGLPEGARRLLEDGALTAGHGRALLAAADPEALARDAASGGLSVRETERRARGKPDGARTKAKRRGKNADVAGIEEELGRALGLTVRILDRGGAGELRIAYRSLEQLDFAIARLRGGPDFSAEPAARAADGAA